MKNIYFLFLLVVLFTNCSKTNPTPSTPPNQGPVGGSTQSKITIGTISFGNLQQNIARLKPGNPSISFSFRSNPLGSGSTTPSNGFSPILSNLAYIKYTPTQPGGTALLDSLNPNSLLSYSKTLDNKTYTIQLYAKPSQHLADSFIRFSATDTGVVISQNTSLSFKAISTDALITLSTSSIKPGKRPTVQIGTQTYSFGLQGSTYFLYIADKSQALLNFIDSSGASHSQNVSVAAGNQYAINPHPSLSSAKSFNSFSILKANNAIPVDGNLVVNGNTITIYLPPGVDKSKLVASFVNSPNSTVQVNGVNQNSGTTANNFTNSVTYTVIAQDGSTQNYTVNIVTDIASIDQVVQKFINTYNIPGLSLAITQNENLVYLKSYGYADVENNQPLTNQNIFRLASVSKQITAITIMKLIEQGKMHLNDTVFGNSGILGNTYGTQPYGPNITKITVNQLLHHTSGGWVNDGTDPMFTNPTFSQAQLISWTLDNRPLTNIPGTTYAYSNFGYCILGRVIEKVSGMSYFNAVNSLVLSPLGINDMSISGNTLADRKTNEVKYYGQGGENPYIYNIARMDAHGGWLASAKDLAWLLVHIDQFPNKADILSNASINTMTTPSTANPNYACGWSVNSAGNWWHSGSLPGTGTEDARTISVGKYNFVILTNTRGVNNNYFSDLDGLFWTAIGNTPYLPTYDLF